MSDAELKLVTDAKNCTMYTIQFLSDDDSEFEKFYAKFRNDLEYNEDFERLLNILGRIADFGALVRFFRLPVGGTDVFLRYRRSHRHPAEGDRSLRLCGDDVDV